MTFVCFQCLSLRGHKRQEAPPADNARRRRLFDRPVPHRPKLMPALNVASVVEKLPKNGSLKLNRVN